MGRGDWPLRTRVLNHVFVISCNALWTNSWFEMDRIEVGALDGTDLPLPPVTGAPVCPR